MRTYCDPRAPLELYLPVVNSALDYATCLHEIGHVLGEDQSDVAVLTRERRAWDWARQNALFWSPEMEQDAQASIAWYFSAS